MPLDLFKVKDLLDNPPPVTQCYLEPKILPKNAIMVMGGSPKLGKSVLCLEICRALATGTDLFYNHNFPTNRCKVLYLEGELGPEELGVRFTRAFENHKPSEWEENLFYGSQLRDFKIEVANCRMDLSNFIEENQINVCIFDPIRMFTNKDENSNNEIGELFQHLQRLKVYHESLGLSFIIVHHFRKTPTGIFRKDYDPLDPHNFSGAGVFYSAPDALFCGEVTQKYEKLVLGKGKCKAWYARMGFVLRKGPPIDEILLDICPEAKQIVTIKSTGRVI